MLPTSFAFRKAIAENTKTVSKATMTLADGTVFELSGLDFMTGSSFSDSTSSNSAFEVGAAVMGSYKFTLRNTDGRWDDYVFTDAVIEPSVGLIFEDGSTEWVRKGVFGIEQPKTYGNTVRLSSLDNMRLLERPYSDVGTVYPATLGLIASDICAACGIGLATPAFANSSATVAVRPSDESMTCLDMISYVAQSSGNWAKCDVWGRLCLDWYDTAAFEDEDWLDGDRFDASRPYASGSTADGGGFMSGGAEYDGGGFAGDRFIHLFAFASLNVATDDVVITGVRVTAQDEVEEDGTRGDEGETALYGTEGYVLEVSGNPLIAYGGAAEAAQRIGLRVAGMRFRPFNASVLGDPSIEAGDPVILTDRRQNQYRSYITSNNWCAGSYQAVSCGAETPSRNSADGYSALTKAIVESRLALRAEKTAREQAFERLNNMIENSGGLYKTSHTMPDGSTIYFLHDKPTLAESSIVWRLSAETFAVSVDGPTGPWLGFDAWGNAILNSIYAIGIDASHVDTGILRSKNGYFVLNLDTGVITISDGKSPATTDQAISGVDVQYRLSDSSSEITGSGEGYAWSTTAPQWAEGAYMWQRTLTEHADGTIEVSDPTCISGARGTTGLSGLNQATVMLYQRAATAPAKPSATLTYTFATASLSGNKGDWTQGIPPGSAPCWVIAAMATSSASTDQIAPGEWSSAVKLVENGADGDDGVGISSTTIRYGKSSSEGTQPSEWQSSIPSVSQGQWLWVKTDYVYTDGSSKTVYSKSYIGTDGEDGTSVYVQSATKSGGTTTVVLTDGTTTNTLTISDGEDGTNGTPGANGYVHVAWATSADGSQGFSTTESANKTYIGAYTDNTEADSTNYRSYSWSLIKGADGEDGADGLNQATVFLFARARTWQPAGHYLVAPSSSMFNVSNHIATVAGTFEDGWIVLDAGAPAKPSVQTTYDFATGTLAPVPSGWSRDVPSGYDACWVTTAVAISNGSTDTIAASEWADATKLAEDGTSASIISVAYAVSTRGEDPPSTGWQSSVPVVARGMWLWVETTYSDNTVAYSCSYVGTDGEDGSSVAIQSVSKANGVTTIVMADSDGTTKTLSIADGEDGANGTPGANGYVHIAWANSADGATDFSTSVSANKKYVGMYTDNTAADSTNYRSYSWSLIKGADGAQGPQGPQGEAGRGVASIVEQYYLSTSDVSLIGGSWSEAQPTWTSGTYIWTRSKVTWSNSSTPTYTTAVLAKALNKANEEAAKANAMVRNYNDGVLVCREGNAVGALVNADGSFDVVSVTWSNGIPSASSAKASFGNTILLGDDGSFGIEISEDLLAFYLEGERAFELGYTPHTSESQYDWKTTLQFMQGLIFAQASGNKKWLHSDGHPFLLKDGTKVKYYDGTQSSLKEVYSLTLGSRNSGTEAAQTLSVGDHNVLANGNSIAVGEFLQSANGDQAIFGMANVSRGSALLIVGNGEAVEGQVYSRSNAFYVDDDGSAWLSGRLTQSSDKRLKKHLSYLGEDACEFVRKLKPVLFRRAHVKCLGFYAQDVQEADEWGTGIVTSCVSDDRLDFETLSLEYTALIAPIVAYAQSLEKRVETLESKLAELTERLERAGI